LKNSPLESICVVVALVENYSTSKPLKVSPEKSHVLSCDTVVANERHIVLLNSFSILSFKGLYILGIKDVFCIVLMSEFSVTNSMRLGCFTTQFKGPSKHYYLQTMGYLGKYGAFCT
jgi:hypothetical protein